ncbi:single-stranded DNA-binding protein [Roseburia intestinalis CAG:13]|nr:single-stranded DNA-binding protein [Roseburia intestinalis CAG:13]
MADKMFENNQVSIVGEIVSDFRFSHEVYGEGFYMVDVAVNRLSNYMDYIPLMISERLIDVNEDMVGQNIYVTGQFRSFNRHEEKKNRLVLSVFVREREFLDEIDDEVKSNQIFLDGYVCKEPIYRKTPLGREIADLLIAVNRSYGKSDYITCICWGRQITFRASAGDEMQDLPPVLMWADMCRSGAGSRAANMSKNYRRRRRKKGLHTKYPSAKLIF